VAAREERGHADGPLGQHDRIAAELECLGVEALRDQRPLPDGEKEAVVIQRL
jgi:hypothetical protein